MKKNVKNLPEFKALIERYKTITLEEIEEAFDGNDYLSNVKESLTGFGFCLTCSLCRATVNNHGYVMCYDCIYEVFNGCQRHETYKAIDESTEPAELLAAYRARAEYMETLLK